MKYNELFLVQNEVEPMYLCVFITQYFFLKIYLTLHTFGNHNTFSLHNFHIHFAKDELHELNKMSEFCLS